MKKTLILLCFMVTLLLCSLTIVSCENSGTKDTETETETEAPIILTDEEKEEVRAKLRSIYEVNTEGAFILNNNVVYHCGPSGFYNSVHGDYYYGNYHEDKNGYAYVSYYNIYDRKDITVLCNIEGCTHDNILCPAHIPTEQSRSSPIITIFPESGKNPVIYIIGRMRQSLSYGGISVNISIDSQAKDALFEFNTQTGTRRTVASRLPFGQLNNAIYYNGILYGTCVYMSSEIDDESNEIKTIIKRIVYSVDVATGECREFENDCGTTIGGVWEGKLYLIDDDGNIYRCNPDFSEAEIMINVGKINNLRTSEGKNKYFLQSFYLSEGRLYYNRDPLIYTDETVTDGIASSTYHSSVFKLYTIDLTSDNLTPTLIDDEVLRFYVYNDMLYYTTFDYKFYGYYTTPVGSVCIDSDNGGNLYRYDPKTGKTDVILRDCGGDISSIEEITDEYITFHGIYYAGLESGYEYKGNTCLSIMRYNFKENNLTIIRDITY